LARLWLWHRATVLAAIAVAAVALIFALVWPITDLIAQHDVGSVAGSERAIQLQTAREAVRGQLLTLGAGLFAAGALTFTALNFTLSRRAIEITEQGQVYSTARCTVEFTRTPGRKYMPVTICSIDVSTSVARLTSCKS
jgi:hypothetical protein